MVSIVALYVEFYVTSR